MMAGSALRGTNSVPHVGCPLPFERFDGADGSETIDYDTLEIDYGNGMKLPAKMMAYRDPDSTSLFGQRPFCDEAEAREALSRGGSRTPCAEGHLGLAKHASANFDEALGHYERAQIDAERELAEHGASVTSMEQDDVALWKHPDGARSWVRATHGIANTLRKLGRVEEALPHYMRLCKAEHGQWLPYSSYVQPKYFVVECLLRCDPPRWSEAKEFMLVDCLPTIQECFTFRSVAVAFRLNLALVMYMEYHAKGEDPPLQSFPWDFVGSDADKAGCHKFPSDPCRIFGPSILTLDGAMPYLLGEKPLPSIVPRLPNMVLGEMWDQGPALVYLERMLDVWQKTEGAITFLQRLAMCSPQLCDNWDAALSDHYCRHWVHEQQFFTTPGGGAPAPPPTLLPHAWAGMGTRVVLHSLASTKYNGLMGTIVQGKLHDDSGRIGVRLDDTIAYTKILRLKWANLKECDQTILPPLNREQCNGCQKRWAVEEANGGTTCRGCGYQACEDCSAHACTCEQPCRNSLDSCSCGSCQNEHLRRKYPSQRIQWFGERLPPLGLVNRVGSGLHHNLSRGTCRCATSNFGWQYRTAEQGACYMGAKGGPQYTGPFQGDDH